MSPTIPIETPHSNPLPSVECSSLLAAQEEFSEYVGIPKCMDCKWKLDTEITNNCACMGVRSDHAKWKTALDRAQFLQKFIYANSPKQ
jgi:hypothetical protein